MELLEQLIAERDIARLLALYAQHADDDADAWAALFVEDGALLAGGQRIEGRPALRAWLLKAQGAASMRHLMMNAVVSVESATTASASMDMALLRADGKQWLLAAAPRYADRLVKTADGWKFLERQIDARSL